MRVTGTTSRPLACCGPQNRSETRIRVFLLKSQTSKQASASKKTPEERIALLEAELLMWKKIATILTVSVKRLQKQLGISEPNLPGKKKK